MERLRTEIANLKEDKPLTIAEDEKEQEKVITQSQGQKTYKNHVRHTFKFIVIVMVLGNYKIGRTVERTSEMDKM